VRETNFEELSQGIVNTEGGTQYSSLIKHIEKHKYKRVLIITDGQSHIDKNDASG